MADPDAYLERNAGTGCTCLDEVDLERSGDQSKTREATMKMHLVALAGLAIGSAVFSGCTNGDSNSTSGQQQNYGLGGVAQSDAFVDWSKPARDQSGPTVPQYEGQSYR